MKTLYHLIDKLADQHSLSIDEYESLIAGMSPDLVSGAAEKAFRVCRRVYRSKVYTRGLIEISSHCRNNCLYCGIRRDNVTCERYRLTPDQIIGCAVNGYRLGFRTFVLQGGEDAWFTDDRMCGIIRRTKSLYPDCAVTLSLGERPQESYAVMREAGADRYLLRQEAADPDYYRRLHPAEMSWENRMRCLRDLRDLGYAVGCGFMVGSPGQMPSHLAADLKFVETFRPEMCGIGPFVPHHATPFRDEPRSPAGRFYFLSLLRLMQPNLLIPATTALGTIDPKGREKGILAGANVVMPNLSPVNVRKKYELYDNKICTGEEAAECRGCLDARMYSVGCHLSVDRGDPAPDPG